MARKPHNRNLTNFLLLIAGALLLALTIGWPLAAQYHIDPATRPVPRSSDSPRLPGAAPAPPAPAAVSQTESSYLGAIIARETVDIAAKYDGRLENVRFALGDRVPANALIATIDTEQLRGELTIAEATLNTLQIDQRKAELVLSEARARRERRAELVATGIFSKEQLLAVQHEVELGELNLESTRARIIEQQARIADLKARLANTEVRAPFAGIVAARHQNVGNIVSRGTPIISLIRSDELWFRFAVPNQQAASIKVGAPIKVAIDHIEPSLTGVVQQIAPEINSAMQMVIVEARLTSPPAVKAGLKPGMIGKASLSR